MILFQASNNNSFAINATTNVLSITIFLLDVKLRPKTNLEFQFKIFGKTLKT